jgi:hypothetical protein
MTDGPTDTNPLELNERTENSTVSWVVMAYSSEKPDLSEELLASIFRFEE